MSRKRVLYAEDDLVNRKFFKIKLEKAGVECDEVENGRLALELFQKNKYDLIILDQYMPELDGEAVAAEIRNTLSDIPLIAITSDDTIKSHLLKKGFNKVLIKPLHGEDAINIVKSYL